MQESLSETLAAPQKPWWKAPLLYLSVVCFALAVVFAHFASEVLERETGTFDRAIRSAVAAHRSPVVLALFGVMTRLGEWVTLIAASALVAGLLVRRGARIRPLLIVSAPFVVPFAVYFLKGWFRVNRPDIGSALTFSFPSGHTSSSTAVVLVIAWVLRREKLGGPAWAFALVVPLLVGVSRVVLDMHWASDVVGGWLIGTAYAAAVCALYELGRNR